MKKERIDEQTAHLCFDIGLLADRLAATTNWLAERIVGSDIKIGYFGASTGAAAAKKQDIVGAVVSRSGRDPI
jgi:putative phosphoribosyl transferase